ncbi:MAG TPA: hypothetical protein VNX68_10535 [Nitrosopumilaceae archaeon]|nr:hypothetical protein [Nitrosopumilaceae archaeon]
MKTLKLLFFALVICTISLQAKDFKEPITEPNESNLTAVQLNRFANEDIEVKLPKYIFSHTNTKISFQFKNARHPKLLANNRVLSFIINGEDVPVNFDEKGLGSVNYSFSGDKGVSIYLEDFKYEASPSIIPIWYVIVPIILIIGLLGFKLYRSKSRVKDASSSVVSPIQENKKLKVEEEALS